MTGFCVFDSHLFNWVCEGFLTETQKSEKWSQKMPFEVKFRVQWPKSHFYYQFPIYIHTQQTYTYVCPLILLNYFSITRSCAFIFWKKVHLRWSSYLHYLSGFVAFPGTDFRHPMLLHIKCGH